MLCTYPRNVSVFKKRIEQISTFSFIFSTINWFRYDSNSFTLQVINMGMYILFYVLHFFFYHLVPPSSSFFFLILLLLLLFFVVFIFCCCFVFLLFVVVDER